LFEKGVKLDCVPLDLLCGEARVVASPARERITKRELQKQNWRGVKRVLFKTRNSRLWGSVGFREDFVHLAEDAAQFLVERGISLVGIDGLSVDRLSSSNLDVHRTFLERGVMIVEGLDLSEPPAGNYELLALPLKILNSDGAPARVILRR
jgi:arylformamidase